MFCSGPDGQKMVQAPRELVAAMSVDCLEQAADDPQIHGQDVKISSDCAPEDWWGDGAETKQHDLDGRGILGCETKRRRVLVMNLVDALIQWAPV